MTPEERPAFVYTGHANDYVDITLWKKAYAAALQCAEEREKLLRACIRPKPRWLPEAIWRRVLARLLVMREFAR